MDNEQTLLRPAKELSRRGFISWIVIAWSAFTSAVVLTAVSTIRFVFPNVLFEPTMIFKAGKLDDYISGEVDERWKERFGVWIIKTDEELYALSTVCTHLGCTPNWLASENKFKCPCHGSGFHKTGINFEGPAPRPLERYKVELSIDGQILVDKTKKFQQEKGEWSQSESKIVLTG